MKRLINVQLGTERGCFPIFVSKENSLEGVKYFERRKFYLVHPMTRCPMRENLYREYFSYRKRVFFILNSPGFTL